MPPRQVPSRPVTPVAGNQPRLSFGDSPPYVPTTPNLYNTTRTPSPSGKLRTPSPPKTHAPSPPNKSHNPSPLGRIPNAPQPSSASQTGVNGLRVFTPEEGGGFRQVFPNEELFNCVASVTSLALDILESKPSQAVLTAYTSGIIKTKLASSAVAKENPETLVLTYLHGIRNSFPHIVVSEVYGMETKNGRTNKKDCPGVFVPKEATVIELSQTLLDKLQGAYQSGQMNMNRFRNLHVRLSLTMAHELVHLYTLFLLRERRNHTPPHITFGPFGDSNTGEAGRSWEGKLLGGFVDMRVASDGVETVALGDNQMTKYWRLTPAVIKGILERDFKYLRPNHDTLTDGELPKGVYTVQMDSLAWKQRYTDFFAGKSVNGPTEMGADQIAMLTSSEFMNKRMYSVSGDVLHQFVLAPKPGIRMAAP